MNIMVINMGLKSIRSIIFSEDGNKLGFASLPLTTQLDEERVMQEPQEWWDKANIVIKESLKQLQEKRIDYITVTASSSCLLCVDKNNVPLERCIMVSDRRAKEQSQKIKEMCLFQKVRDATGININACLMLPKILWILENESNLFARTAKFLSPNDFLIAKLSGIFCTDTLNAQKYHFDVNKYQYPKDLLFSLGINEEMLPQVVEPGTVIGKINIEVARETGLNDDAEIVISTYDAICSFWGSGVSNEGDASDASGTVTAFRALSYQKELRESKNVFITPYKNREISIVGGSNNLGGGLIEWVKQCYYLNETLPYEIMEKEANEVRVGAGGLVFIPYLLGERAPIWNQDARGVFFGLERMHTRKDMVRAVFESTGFIDRDMIVAIEETGVEISKIKLSGGLARNNTISQIKADVTGKIIEVLEDFETTAIGAAMIVLTGIGKYKNLIEASKEFVTIRMLIYPNYKRSKQYDELYGLYKETYEITKPIFAKRMGVINKIYNNREIQIENL